jgi:hypothetical protein
MLIVTAFKSRHPMLFFVLVEANDAPVHSERLTVSRDPLSKPVHVCAGEPITKPFRDVLGAEAFVEVDSDSVCRIDRPVDTTAVVLHGIASDTAHEGSADAMTSL